MAEDRRNPYFILGIDYGASRDAARKASGCVIRKVKREPDAVYGIEDVTWALHQVEQAIDDPASAINHFRVPANPDLFAEAPRIVLSLPPTPLPRATPAPTPDELDGLRARALDEVLETYIRAAADHLDLSLLFPARKEECE
jgi:hypothetical protein